MQAYRRVALLGLLGIAGEDNQTRLVRLEALHVESLALLAQVPPSVIHDDTNSTGSLATDSGFL